MQNIAGKIIGFLLGYLFWGRVGGVLGLVLGHLHDCRTFVPFRHPHQWAHREAEKNYGSADTLERATYTIGVIVLSAKMAKIDGHVSRAEIDAFKRVFRIDESQSAEVGKIFDQARQSPEGYEPYAMRLSQVFRHNRLVLEEILTGLFIVAASDSRGFLSQTETKFLTRVAVLFGMTEPDFVRIAARSGVFLPGQPAAASPEKSSYTVLGLPENATDADVKKTYRALIRQHHPDKLIAQGLPPELISQANEKMKRINAAYDAICKARGIK